MFINRLTITLILSVMTLAFRGEAAEYSDIRMSKVNIKNQGEAATLMA